MKEFFKPNKFKIIFSFVYMAVFYSLNRFLNFHGDYLGSMFDSFQAFVIWIMAWPLMFAFRLVDWYQRNYEGCSWLCFPGTKMTIVIFALVIIYVYILSCVVSAIKQKIKKQ